MTATSNSRTQKEHQGAPGATLAAHHLGGLRASGISIKMVLVIDSLGHPAKAHGRGKDSKFPQVHPKEDKQLVV